MVSRELPNPDSSSSHMYTPHTHACALSENKKLPSYVISSP
jgi:hypothetical protein